MFLHVDTESEFGTELCSATFRSVTGGQLTVVFFLGAVVADRRDPHVVTDSRSPIRVPHFFQKRRRCRVHSNVVER